VKTTQTLPSHFLLNQNAEALQKEFAWFEEFLWKRAELTKQSANQKTSNFIQIDFLTASPPPRHTDSSSVFAQLIQKMEEEAIKEHPADEQPFRTIAERLVLMLTLAPHIKPQLLDIFFYPNAQNREFTEFGGVKGQNHKGFLPTGETAMYMLAGDNLSLRFMLQQIFEPKHFFYRHHVLKINPSNSNEPWLSGALEISKEYLQLLTTGEPYQPQYSADFPAQSISTKLHWEDLILDYYTQQGIEEVKAWIKHRDQLVSNPEFSKEIKGYRCLFYGESGTGKTLTTMLLGKEVDLPVYRIDLSKIVSKYIGETEKNLNHIFEQAENREWILFFDEGDALFGKRTQTKDAHDRYANQEVSYLLQKIEEHPGIIILATNLRSNLDKAFLRRFQSEVYFPMPDEQSRLRLWQKSFAGQFSLDPKIDIKEIAQKYELSGAAIKNIKHYCAMMSIDKNTNIVSPEDFREGLRKQLDKEGKKL
jgi:ATPase family associated with various cellular activities (AAA)